MALSALQIQVLYQNVLQREPSPAEATSFLTASSNGTLTDAQVYASIVGSEEAQNGVHAVLRIYQTCFGRVADKGGLDQQTDSLVRGGFTVNKIAAGFIVSQEFANRFNNGVLVTDNAAAVSDGFLQALYQNVLGRTGSTAELAAWKAEVAKGQAYKNASDVLYGFSQSPEFILKAASAITTFLTQAGQGIATYSGALLDPTAITGQTFTLTSAPDNIAGTKDNDVINGVFDANTAANSTLTAADILNGGTGTDQLNLTVTAGAGSLPVANYTSIEKFFIRDVGTGGTYSFTSILGEEQVYNDRSTANVVFFNVGSSSTAGQGATIGLKGDGATTMGNTTITMASVTDQLNIVLENGVKTNGFVSNVVNTNAPTATLTSSGATNTVNQLQFANGQGLLTTLNISASSDLVITTGLTNADFKANAGVLNVSGVATNVSLGAAINNLKTIDASGMSNGGLTIALGTGTQSFKGGVGVDTVTTNSLSTSTASAVDGGNGTDILKVGTTADVDTASEAAVYAGFETLDVQGNTVDVSFFTNSSISAIRLGTAASVSNLSAAQAGAITAYANGSHKIGVTGASNAGQIDTVRIDANDGKATVSTISLNTPTLTGVENLELIATDNVTISNLSSAAALTSVKVSGAGTSNVTTGAVTFAVNSKFDFSLATGAVTFDASTAQGTGTTGLAIVGSSTATNSIRDSLRADVVSGGSMADTITYTGGADQVTLGGSGDTFNFNAKVGSSTTGATGPTFKFTSGDSISKAGATFGFDATVTDVITGIRNDAAFGGGSGQAFTIDSLESATAVMTSATTVVLGATVVTSANDFYVQISPTSADAYVYQDTNGNKVIDAGDLAVKLTGAGAAGSFTAGEFSISAGNLLYTSA